MSKLAFIFDTVMLKDENDNYYAINLNYKLWEDRYLKVYDEMIVSTRSKNMKYSEIKEKRGYTISNGKNVEIYPATEYNKITDIFFKKRKIKIQLKKIIHQADDVIIRLPSPLGNLACDVCRECGKKYAIEMVTCPWDSYRNHGHWAGKLVAPYMYFQTKKQCKKAKRVLYVTENFLQHRYPTSGATTNASNVMINESSDGVLEERLKKIKEKDSDYILGLVGSLDLKFKGHMVALKAIKIVKKQYPSIKIKFLGIGTGEKLKNYIKKEHLEDNVVFDGTLPGGNPVLEWMDSLDILVIPSFQEGLPRVLIEAMSRGCPATGSSAGGIPELIRKDIIHKPGDYKKLASDILKILADKKLMESLAIENFNNAKQYAKENLDLRRNKFWREFRDNNQ